MSFVGDIIGDITGSNQAEKTAERSASDMLEAQKRAEALSERRYEDAITRLEPYMMGGRTGYEQYLAQLGMGDAEAIDPMDTAAYRSMMDATRRGIEESSASQGMLHSGQFMRDIGTGMQDLIYGDYMNRLAQLGGSGQNVAANLGSLGVGQAATLGSQLLGAQQSAGQMRMQGAGIGQQASGDLLGALGTGLGMYFGA